MNYDINEALDVMDNAFRLLEEIVPSPAEYQADYGLVPRYREQAVEQAMVLLLAKLQSGLRASALLLHENFLNEQALLQRVMEETNEDVLFLVYGLTNDDIKSDIHQRFLTAFWNDDYYQPDDTGSTVRKPDRVVRSKIQSYITQKDRSDNPHGYLETMKKLSRGFGGFVHSSAPHILDLHDGIPPRLQTRGLHETSKQLSHAKSLWNVVYGALLSHVFVCRMFGNTEQLSSSLVEYIKAFAKEAGEDYFT